MNCSPTPIKLPCCCNMPKEKCNYTKYGHCDMSLKARFKRFIKRLT